MIGFRRRAIGGMAVVVAAGAGGCSGAPAKCVEPGAVSAAVAGAPVSTTVPALAHDLPEASEWQSVQTTLTVDVAADGKRFVDGSPVEEDGALLARAREAKQRHPELRAVIRADASVAYARVIGVMDLLKQVGVSKIAFGVVPPPGSEGGQSSPAPAPVSLARNAAPGGRNVWACAFPPEANVAQVDRAAVVVQVTVDASGKPVSARVLSDPGYGFGAAAVKCALAKVYFPALDSAGRPIEGVTPPIRVTYMR